MHKTDLLRLVRRPVQMRVQRTSGDVSGHGSLLLYSVCLAINERRGIVGLSFVPLGHLVGGSLDRRAACRGSNFPRRIHTRLDATNARFCHVNFIYQSRHWFRHKGLADHLKLNLQIGLAVGRRALEKEHLRTSVGWSQDLV